MNEIMPIRQAMPKMGPMARHIFSTAQLAGDRRTAGDLMLALASVECCFALGGATAVPAAILRDVVILASRLSGRPWLETVAGMPISAAFLDFASIQGAPGLDVLDIVLSAALRGKFPQVRVAAE